MFQYIFCLCLIEISQQDKIEKGAWGKAFSESFLCATKWDVKNKSYKGKKNQAQTQQIKGDRSSWT